MLHHSGHCCFTIGTGNRNDGNGCRSTRRVKMIKNICRYISPLSFGRIQMHPQARSRIDFYYGSTLLGKWPGYIICHDIDTCNIQIDNSGCFYGNFFIGIVDFQSTIPRTASSAQITILPQINDLVFFRYIINGQIHSMQKFLCY